MSGGSCKAAICSSQLSAAAISTESFVAGGLTTTEQNDEVIEITEKAIKALNRLADEIPDPA